MSIQGIGERCSKRQVTLGAAAVFVESQIAFLYLLFQIDGYVAAVLLGALHVCLIMLLSHYSGVRLDSNLTLRKDEDPAPNIIVADNQLFVRYLRQH